MCVPDWDTCNFLWRVQSLQHTTYNFNSQSVLTILIVYQLSRAEALPKSQQCWHRMNFVKKAGKSVSKAAKGAANGVELETLKARKNTLTKNHEDWKVKHAEYLVYRSEISVLVALTDLNNQHKSDYVKKLSEVPLENNNVRETYQQIINTLSTANESLLKSLAFFHKQVGDVTEDYLENATIKYEAELEEINDRLAALRALRAK